MYDYFLLFFAVCVLVAGISSLRRGKYLLKRGMRANGIVYKNNLIKGEYYPVIRFLTHKQEWVTQELNAGYTYAKKEGTEVEIIYDPDDPIQIELNSPFSLQGLPIVLITVGIILLLVTFLQIAGLTKLFDV